MSDITVSEISQFTAKLGCLLDSKPSDPKVIEALQTLNRKIESFLQQGKTKDGLTSWLMVRRKEPRKSNRGKFAKKYCVLMQDGLHLYESMTDLDESAFIETGEMKSVSYDQSGTDGSLLCLLLNGDTFFEFQCSNEDLLKQWHVKLRASIPVGFSLFGEDETSKHVLKEGFIMKQKEKSKGLSSKKRRYCILNQFNLEYFDKKGGAKYGELSLIGLLTHFQILDSAEEVMKFILQDKTMYTFTKANDGDSIRSWFEAVNEAQLKFKPSCQTTSARNYMVDDDDSSLCESGEFRTEKNKIARVKSAGEVKNTITKSGVFAGKLERRNTVGSPARFSAFIRRDKSRSMSEDMSSPGGRESKSEIAIDEQN